MDPSRRKIRVAFLSVISNCTLVILKLIVGLLIGSVSIISESIHSGGFLAAIIALFSVRTSGIPADKQHPFGHGKVENISGTIEAFLIFAAAGWITYEAINKLRHPGLIEAAGWGVGVMLISATANIIVSHLLFKVGKQTDSMPCSPMPGQICAPMSTPRPCWGWRPSCGTLAAAGGRSQMGGPCRGHSGSPHDHQGRL